MRIDKVRIRNFRGIEDLEINLHKQFNLFIGENGAGKTAILEALAVAVGSFFSGMPGIQSRHIRITDIRYFKTPEGSYEYTANTKIEVLNAQIIGKEISWYKERNGPQGSNIMGKGSPVRLLSEELNNTLKDSKRTTSMDLPVIAYYSTARLWKVHNENKKEEGVNDTTVKRLPTRYRGYKDALEIRSTFKIMLDWFKSKFSEIIVNQNSTFQLDCVRDVIINNIPGATKVKWVFDKDQIQMLYIVFDNGLETPFHFLSDGYRNLLAIFADLAYRCVTLNPHFGKEANLKSEGIVLIDELDLHLHPAWQQDLVKNLKQTFPKIQFIATTHSPFILQEMEDNEVFKINSTADKILAPLKGLNRLGVEDIAEDIQGVDTPNMSHEREEMFKAAEKYYSLLNLSDKETNPGVLQDLKDKLDSITEKYSDDVAYYAFLKQERLARGIK